MTETSELQKLFDENMKNFVDKIGLLKAVLLDPATTGLKATISVEVVVEPEPAGPASSLTKALAAAGGGTIEHSALVVCGECPHAIKEAAIKALIGGGSNKNAIEQFIGCANSHLENFGYIVSGALSTLANKAISETQSTYCPPQTKP